ncbi:MAG: hypothetical protein HQL95_02585 [Magnetococcales bacterium]|nr:hypothetical protein [Magnetococcales bacterium]
MRHVHVLGMAVMAGILFSGAGYAAALGSTEHEIEQDMIALANGEDEEVIGHVSKDYLYGYESAPYAMSRDLALKSGPGHSGQEFFYSYGSAPYAMGREVAAAPGVGHSGKDYLYGYEAAPYAMSRDM